MQQSSLVILEIGSSKGLSGTLQSSKCVFQQACAKPPKWGFLLFKMQIHCSIKTFLTFKSFKQILKTFVHLSMLTSFWTVNKREMNSYCYFKHNQAWAVYSDSFLYQIIQQIVFCLWCNHKPTGIQGPVTSRASGYRFRTSCFVRDTGFEIQVHSNYGNPNILVSQN